MDDQGAALAWLDLRSTWAAYTLSDVWVSVMLWVDVNSSHSLCFFYRGLGETSHTTHVRSHNALHVNRTSVLLQLGGGVPTGPVRILYIDAPLERSGALLGLRRLSLRLLLRFGHPQRGVFRRHAQFTRDDRDGDTEVPALQGAI